ncbi:MAG: hypothetical protein B7X41_15605 [Microbacterium sp. 14-71-5]|nr:MAG: hypothetical protein B7X41_15605 [Microbacterium sp. 14-71-5]
MSRLSPGMDTITTTAAVADSLSAVDEGAWRATVSPGSKDCASETSGSQEWAHSLFEEHHSWALGYARRNTRSRHDAEDVVGNVFLAMVRAKRNGAGAVSNIRGYLARAIRNEAARLTARPVITVSDVPERATLDIDRVERAIDRAALLAGHPARWRDLLYWVDVCGHSATDAARELGMTVSAAAAALHRARKALRDAAGHAAT